MEGPKERWMEGAHGLQMAFVAQTQDRFDSSKNIRRRKHGGRLQEYLRLHIEGRQIGCLLFLSGNDHLVRFSL